MKPTAIIALMVTSDRRTSFSVRQYTRAISPSDEPIVRPARIDARKMPLPVADSQLMA